MRKCRECGRDVSGKALICPGCGVPYPARDKWDGWGFEYKSGWKLFGLPVLHVSFKYRPPFIPVPARGVIAVGQFAAGFVTFSQFGIGVVSVGQLVVAGYALAQFAAAYSLIAQVGLYVNSGRGQVVRSIADVMGRMAGF